MSFRYFFSLIASLSAALAFLPAELPAQQKHIYLANDNHTDYFWSGNAQDYIQVALNEIDYYLNQADATQNLPAPFQGRYNLDGAWYAYTYKQHRSPVQFERLMSRIRSGHISLPYNFFVSTYGGQPTEAILRGMYWPARLAREHGLDISLAVSMENQTLPLGLASLWAGSGARYSWKGVCGCASPVSTALLQNRSHEIYRYQGLDGSGVVMKWYSLSNNTSLGGYAEARNTYGAVASCEAKCNTPKYPYHIAGAFGFGWDDLAATNDFILQTVQAVSDANRQAYVSNERDFFEHFLSEYDEAGLPVESLTYGNDWDMDCEALAAVTSRVRRSVEKLRTAEALASVVSLADPAFFPSQSPEREAAWVALGSYWEHNFGLGGCCSTERGHWQQGLEEDVRGYVDGLYESALNALAGKINNPSPNTRFLVFNALGWPRTDVADLPYAGGPEIKVVDMQTGQEAPHQLMMVDGVQRLRLLARDVPSAGYKVYEIRQEAGAGFPNAASLQGQVFENAFYRLSLTSQGAITSLIDKMNGGQELVKATGGRYVNDFGQGAAEGGALTLLHSGPVSATVACTSPSPLQHTSCITLYADINRIDIDNRIDGDFGDAIRTYSFSFDFSNPTLRHEELGAVLKAKYSTNGGHYAPPGQPVRHDWQTLNHFADVGTAERGVTLSNLGAGFMKLGNSSLNFLDEASAQLNVLIGGKMGGSGPGFSNQFGATDFRHSFALRSRQSAFSAAQSMRFALEHQNGLAAALIGSQDGPLPDTAFSLLNSPAPEVLLWALKPAEEGLAEGGLILRLWNLDSLAQNTTLSFSGEVLDARKTTHLETDIEPANAAGGALAASFAPHEMATFRVFLDSAFTSCALQITVSRAICQGESYEGYTETGIYTDTFTASNGCDSTRVLSLTVLPPAMSSEEASICQGESYEGYTAAGVYTDTFTAANGCDSTRLLRLTVLPAFSTLINRTICAGEDYEGYTETGTYTDTLAAANGCDSIRILNLVVVLPIDTVRIEQLTCDSAEVGVFTLNLASQDGCDSTVVITAVFSLPEPNLEVQPASGGANNGAASVSPVGGQEPYFIQWSTGGAGPEISGLAPGDYSVTVTDAGGCSVSVDFVIGQVNSLRDIPSLEYFSLYPNPASGRIHLEWRFSRREEGVFILQDQQGREVYREAFRGEKHRTETGAEHLPAGLYLARLIVNSGEVVRYLAVQH